MCQQTCDWSAQAESTERLLQNCGSQPNRPTSTCNPILESLEALPLAQATLCGYLHQDKWHDSPCLLAPWHLRKSSRDDNTCRHNGPKRSLWGQSACAAHHNATLTLPWHTQRQQTHWPNSEARSNRGRSRPDGQDGHGACAEQQADVAGDLQAQAGAEAVGVEVDGDQVHQRHVDQDACSRAAHITAPA